jgi:hypothetical protein
MQTRDLARPKNPLTANDAASAQQHYVLRRARDDAEAKRTSSGVE